MVREVNPPSRKSYDATSATRVKIGPIRACRAESESFAPTPCRWPSHAGEEQQAKPGRARLLCGVPVSGLPLPKQSIKLHHRGRGWSLHNVWPDANRPNHPRATLG